MKQFFTIACAIAVAVGAWAQPIRVLSNQKIGEGFSPRISTDGSRVAYLGTDQAQHVPDLFGDNMSTDISVSNRDLQLLLTRDGQTVQLTPAGDVPYVWASVSPDQTKVVYTTKYGTAVCNLDGQQLVNLGHLNAPQWFGNDYIVGMYEQSDGHFYTAAAIAIRSLDGTVDQVLTDPDEIGMYPSVSPETGRIVYETIDGDIRLLQTNVTDQPVRHTLPDVFLAPALQDRRKAAPVTPGTMQPSQVRIYINPGHGGYTGNDRGMSIYPFERNSVDQFWESKSNLQKGLILRDMLRDMGYNVMMSRADVPVQPRTNENYYAVATANNPEEDDLDLSVIVAQANAYDAHFMLSIHSNAGGPSNYTLMLYSGKDETDNVTYADYGTRDAESRAISTIIGYNIMSNQNATWGPRTEPWIAGDKTFARTIMGWSNGYGVLRYLRVPGLISEGRMHDYFPETYRMMNMDYQRDEAWAFFTAFNQYFCGINMPNGAISGQVRDWYNRWIFPQVAKRPGSRDELLPLTGAVVELLHEGQVIRTYTTDDLYNGVFYFWDLTPGQYRVRVNVEHYYPMEYDYTVEANQIAYHDFLMNKKRESRPEVVSYLPHPQSITDSVDVSTDIVLNFNWDMWEEKTTPAFSITPAVEGTLSYEDSYRTLRFKPAHSFQKGTEYTVRLLASAAHPDTAFTNTMAQDFEFRFRTKDRDAIRIMSQYPADGAEQVPLKPSFLFILDEKINAQTARNAFSLTDPQGAEVPLMTRSMECNKLASPFGSIVFETTNTLIPNTTYTMTISRGLKDNIGVFLNRDVTFSFTTQDDDAPSFPLVDRLDTLLFVADAEKSVFISSASTLRNTAKKLTPAMAASNELAYSYSQESTDAIAYFAIKNPMLIHATCYDELGLYVFSDLSNNDVELVWNSEGDIHYTPVCTLDYGGWKWQTVDLSALPEGLSFQLMGLRVRRGSGLLAGSGKLYLNNLCYMHHDAPSALEQLENATSLPAKRIQNGQFIILRNGTRYNALGQLIE
ncbi:MAG: Ig-like domain-containing protein [Paludibacteraceae bacterium]|nr:Ig-like domain-containing protein [Paludibacteraceae bacterium]